MLSHYNNILSFFFFFNDTATTEIYTLSLHDALPICRRAAVDHDLGAADERRRVGSQEESAAGDVDRKSTRLNSSHSQISYAVFCLKKKTRTALSLTLPDPRLSFRSARHDALLRAAHG